MLSRHHHHFIEQESAHHTAESLSLPSLPPPKVDTSPCSVYQQTSSPATSGTMQIPIQPKLVQARVNIPIPLVISSFPGECEWIYIWVITPNNDVLAGTAMNCGSGFAKSPNPLNDDTESAAAGSSSTASPDGTMYTVWTDVQITERGHYGFHVVGYTADHIVADEVWSDWYEVGAERVALSDLREDQQSLLDALRQSGNFDL
ncbi:trans-aconitate 2-methyltransferase [Apiospora arundinis]